MPRGSVRSGSWISWLAKAPISNPAKAKQKPDHRLIVPKTSPRGTSVAGAKRRRRSDRAGHDRGADDQQRHRHPGADDADVLQPAPGLEALDADADREPQEAEDEDRREDAVVAQARGEVAEHRRGVGRREEQQRREVEQVVDPQAPAAERAGERPEGAMDPGVDAALLGILLRQHRDGEGQRHEEGQPGQHPQQHRRRAGAGAAGNPAQAGDGDDGEEDDVPEAEDPLQLRRRRVGPRRRVIGRPVRRRP